jgi:hypothetical protein
MRPNDELTPLESRLADCRPAATGLDADAMLFAAGKAADRGARIAWPVVACTFALLSIGLGTALVGERSERIALAARLSRSVPIATATDVTVAATLPAPSVDSYMTARRMIEIDPDGWLSRPDSVPSAASPSDMERPILHAWPVDAADLQP